MKKRKKAPSEEDKPLKAQPRKRVGKMEGGQKTTNVRFGSKANVHRGCPIGPL